MGGACGACGEGERRVQDFGGGKLRERDHWGIPGADGSSGSGLWQYGLDRAGSE